MSESGEGTNDGQQAGSEQQSSQTFSQEQVNALLAEQKRKTREQFADYNDLRTKAAKLEEIESASLTAAERAAQKIAAAEAEVSQVPAKVADALRAHLVALHEIPADDAELFLTATDPELLLKQVQRLVGRETDRKKQGNRVPREGTSSAPSEGAERETARALFG